MVQEELTLNWRDGTAIAAREKPAAVEAEVPVKPAPLFPAEALRVEATPAAASKRGRPKRGEERPPKPSRIERRRKQSLARMIQELPKHCDRGTQCHAKECKVSPD